MSQVSASSSEGSAPAAHPSKRPCASLFRTWRRNESGGVRERFRGTPQGRVEETRPGESSRGPAGLDALGSAVMDEGLRDEQRRSTAARGPCSLG
eukprot:5677338-Pyramimonas_sp.AAC.1